MKTWKRLFEKIVSFENLVLAATRARKRKRLKPATATFDLNLENNLLRLQRELQDQIWQPGEYISFEIFEPKRRLISAAPYEDRVVHHALCNIIEPLFERTFIYDSYANRQGKGTHRAVDRLTKFAKQYRYVLKCDIQKYFPSIDHEILYGFLTRKISDKKVRWLLRTIIDSSNPQEPGRSRTPGACNT
jgi:RNA-directed DNA polymerase